MQLNEFRIGIIGGGTVGSAIASAYTGHVRRVRVYDIEPTRSTHHSSDVVEDSDVVFVCLPENQVEGFLYRMPIHIRQIANIVIKSTVPIGTTERLAKELDIPRLTFSPEFLTARTAVCDANNPRINIIGYPSITHIEPPCPIPISVILLHQLYRLRFPHIQCLLMSASDAEAVKIFMNTFFAIKVSMFNELREVAKGCKLNWNVIRNAMLADGRIYPLHTQVPGPDGLCGFGGTCLPKDLDEFIMTNPTLTLIAEAARERNKFDRG